jgi:hypothetical protein
MHDFCQGTSLFTFTDQTILDPTIKRQTHKIMNIHIVRGFKPMIPVDVPYIARPSGQAI